MLLFVLVCYGDVVVYYVCAVDVDINIDIFYIYGVVYLPTVVSSVLLLLLLLWLMSFLLTVVLLCCWCKRLLVLMCFTVGIDRGIIIC